MSYKKPAPEGPSDPKTRHCLACQQPFDSDWAGERICRRCKSSSAWRGGNVRQHPKASPLAGRSRS